MLDLFSFLDKCLYLYWFTGIGDFDLQSTLVEDDLFSERFGTLYWESVKTVLKRGFKTESYGLLVQCLETFRD